jgi:twitching motility protein PilT
MYTINTIYYKGCAGVYMNIFELLRVTAERKASDLHISVGVPPICRIDGRLVPVHDKILKPEDTDGFVQEILTPHQLKYLKERGEIDLSISAHGHYRFRMNAYRQRGSYSIAFRLVSSEILSFEALGIPHVAETLCTKMRGLVLVTGPTGSGKSTTLATMIDKINRERDCHIITLEEPIEYLHKHKKSIVHQREIGSDSNSYSNALRACLRQDPDVILIGEMRDLETISIALTAAETGHLVLSTLHTSGADKSIDRIIDVFPPHQQQQVKFQMSTALQGIISQQLIPTVKGDSRAAAVEVMITTPAIKNLIREGKTHQIKGIIETGVKYGMKSMDASLLELYRRGKISLENTLNYAVDQEHVRNLLSSSYEIVS